MASTPIVRPPDVPYPNAARIYDYTLGGSFNTEADRQAAEYMFQLLPSTQKWVQMLRAFLQRAARDMYAEGFTQFLDLGSGLPTQDHIHHVLPDAQVIYVDRDEPTVEYGQQAVAGLPNVHYLQGDLLDLEAILKSPTVRQAIDLNQKVALGLNGITVFFTQEQLRHLATTLYNWAPTGSQIFITFETKEIGKSSPAWDSFVDMFAQAGSPFYLLSLEENMELMRPWQPIRIEPVADYLGLPPDYVTEADREGVGIEFYAARLQK